MALATACLYSSISVDFISVRVHASTLLFYLISVYVSHCRFVLVHVMDLFSYIFYASFRFQSVGRLVGSTSLVSTLLVLSGSHLLPSEGNDSTFLATGARDHCVKVSFCAAVLYHLAPLVVSSGKLEWASRFVCRGLSALACRWQLDTQRVLSLPAGTSRNSLCVSVKLAFCATQNTGCVANRS